MLPYVIWEVVLLLGVVIVGIAMTASVSAPVFSANGIWGLLAYIGMYAAALALSFRTATPNLAVTTIGAACGWWYVHLANDGSTFVAWLVVLIAALGIGLVMAVLVGLTPLPAWAVTLVVLAILGASLRLDANATPDVILHSSTAGASTYIAWSVVFIVGSIAGGILFAIPAVRTALSQNRVMPGEQPRLLGRFLGAVVGLGGSSVLAAVGGVLLTLRIHSAQPFDTLGIAFALSIVLLAGVSVLGRRGGVLGVALATVLLVLIQDWMLIEDASSGVVLFAAGLIGLFGLGISALLDWLSRLVEGPPGAGAPFPAAQPVGVPSPAGSGYAPVPVGAGYPPPWGPGGYPPPGGGAPGQPPQYPGSAVPQQQPHTPPTPQPPA
jgi:ribose/xylose/arabinose/galactoside ABC-type transport system permease subunit